MNKKMQYDCVVAGAGPAGCVCARELSGAGFNVLLLEEHEKIGEPVHCTGIVGEKLREMQTIPEECIIKSIDSVKVVFPSGESLKLPTPIRPLLINRAIFDRHLFDQAVESGVTTRTLAKVENVLNQQKSVQVSFLNGNGIETVDSKLCIIATGAVSGLPSKLGLEGVEHKYYAAQTEIRIKDIDGIELYPGGDYAKGSFAYLVSIDGDKAKAGLITKGNIREKFEIFLNSPLIRDRLISIDAHPTYRLMPFGLPKKTVQSRIITVGDAACQLKSTTGGGVFYGIKCAHILADQIKEAATYSKTDDFNLNRLKQYEKQWRKEFGFEIQAGLILRDYLEKRSDEWWNRVHAALRTEDALDLISSYRDFDRHRTFISDFFKKPGILKLLLEFIDIDVFREGNFQNK
jgi:geranylgeranyl reductase family protein